MQKYWFKAKNYGWGWYPASWQGFMVMIIYFLLLIPIFLQIDGQLSSSSKEMYSFMIPVLLLTTILIVICYLTGEKPRWRWGK